MNKPIFELKKVVDPHTHMPEDIKKAFFRCMEDHNLGNDSYVDWRIGEEEHDDDSLIVNNWLLSNGLAKSEQIIILYWW